MNSYLLKNLSGITSASIEKYLLFTGWEKDDTFANPRIWVFKNKYDPELTIAVPASEHVKDFYSRVGKIFFQKFIFFRISYADVLHTEFSRLFFKKSDILVCGKSYNTETVLFAYLQRLSSYRTR